MSGSHLVEESPQAAVNATETSAEDSAASLRAAALRTLKSKRRKLTGSSEPTIPPRPVVQQQSIQLDYGPEEPSGAASSIASSPALQPVTSSVPVSEPMEIDAGAREEGEISDSEMSPPPPSVKPQPEPTSPTSAQPPQPVVQMLPPPVPKVEPISPALSKAIAAPAATAAPLVTPDKYYRPGLAMTEAQYLTARDIILDLLGWGVPPEYLVNCGLSREIIFYIFVEYNLRLPSNLDVTGLLPYISSSMPSATANATSPAQPSQTQNVPAQADVPSSLSASAAPFVPGSSSGSSTPSSYLLDIEQQRKQELLARKAVVASLKLKQQKSTSSVESHTADYGTSIASSTTNTAAALPVLTGTVDDFLNSIDSAGLHNDTSKPSGSVAEPRVRSFSVDAMDVDEVPGLSGGFSVTTDYTPLLRPPPTRSATMSSVPSPKSPVVPHSAVSDRSFYAPPAFTNGNGLSYGGNDDDSDAIPGLFQTRSPSVESQVMGSRRGTKRPVAADFVDMDPGPSRVSARAPPKRRSTGFAGLPQRRCVIELSDSEDEREDGVAYTNGLPSRAESRGPQANTPQVSVAPTPRVNSPANSINPTALLEKEEQIRRMREKIAQRQQEKLKKQAATSTSRSTPSIIGAQSIASVAIKQEEDESSTARSLQVSRSSTSATPDPSAAVRRPGDDTEEQSVAAAGLPYETGGSITLLESESSSVPATPIGSHLHKMR
ncbi:hypothetical protein L226DRAFT_323500 [Lentinus tigrinus ALCF2SS1-7]|uniref:uncharacterized protein n=1 Tax=Lentinus tigrinus ALCF2SS1-7 TaxID=1328758 RepID=UPI0011663D73|nr:hypothetical protein L226DRAFT_323500 [Lentinus tigrinus ALCF2SS1-7]